VRTREQAREVLRTQGWTEDEINAALGERFMVAASFEAPEELPLGVETVVLCPDGRYRRAGTAGNRIDVAGDGHVVLRPLPGTVIQ